MKGTYLLCTEFPHETPTCELTVDAAAGDGETEAVGKPGVPWASSQGRVERILATSAEVAGASTLQIEYTALTERASIVAVDHQGKIYSPNRSSVRFNGGGQTHQASFSIQLATIAEFRLRTQPRGTVTFEEIPLKPGGN